MNKLSGVALVLMLALAGCGKHGVSDEIDRQEKAAAAKAAAVQAEGEAFLQQNRAKPGVTATASGLQIEVVRPAPAGAPHPTAADAVTVNYEGAFPDGRVFDSSYQRGEPASFPLNAVIAAWTEAVPLMAVGEEIRLVVPSALGYGAQGAPPDIPGNQVLVFRIELLGFKRPDGSIAGKS
jgi:FKBP-type peptidyl-prolyl cis-trans isomerase FklB